MLDSVIKNQSNLKSFMSISDTENNVQRIMRQVADLTSIAQPIDGEVPDRIKVKKAANDPSRDRKKMHLEHKRSTGLHVPAFDRTDAETVTLTHLNNKKVVIAGLNNQMVA